MTESLATSDPVRLSVVDQCPCCDDDELREEKQHFRCPSCGFIEPCCEGS